MSKTIKIPNKKQTKIIAHRGLSGLETENTLPAFQLASSLSYYGMECDIHKTKDGIYAISHDEDLTRVFGSELVIKENNYRDLVSASRLKDGIHVIPTLEEYLRSCSQHGKKAIIELKVPFNSQDIKEILDICHYCISDVIFISFYYDDLMLLRENGFSGPIQLLYFKEITPEFVKSAEDIQADVDIQYCLATADAVKMFHVHDIKVNVWTVDDKEKAVELIANGVDYITTNILE